jgi:predicted HTH domain antitoxin
MKAVGIRELKDNPTDALRAARSGPVLITNRDDPEALLLSLRGLGPDEPDVRIGLATALYDQGVISLGRAARLARVPLEAFMLHLGSRGIPVFRLGPDELAGDLATLEA